MIVSVSSRTDIPAYFSQWFIERVKQGYVYVRNPYYPSQVTKYLLNKDVVDCFVFCTKNPKPIFQYLDQLKEYPMYFFVTVTPYDKTIEPNVPHYLDVIKDIKYLSNKLGKQNVCLRYDPIFINDIYTIEKHIQYFDEMTSLLEGYIEDCVISFIDLYEKTKRNFPNIKEVSIPQQITLASAFSKIASAKNIKLKACAEQLDLSEYGISQEGCISQRVLEKTMNCELKSQKSNPLRKGCHCFVSKDIGEYNTCMHGCLYCYANEDKQKVITKFKQHDPFSPLLIGNIEKDDIIKQAKQESYKERQLSLDI
ncbi:MAG: DUF1848 domain-containing protein [Coprobacillus sp.]